MVDGDRISSKKYQWYKRATILDRNYRESRRKEEEKKK